MSTDESTPLTAEELAGEGVTALPDKEVVSILDLAADVDLAIDGAAPIDLAVALNANVVAPIDAAVSANVLSDNSSAQALADQGVQVTQTVDADAVATGVQDSTIDQGDTSRAAPPPPPRPEAPATRVLGATTTTSDATQPDALSGAAQAGAAETAGDTAGSDDLVASGAPVDGSVVVDSTGAVIGTLDGATGNVVAADGTVLGTLNEATGVVVDSAGNLIGTVTGLVDGASVLGSDGQVWASSTAPPATWWTLPATSSARSTR